MSETVKKDLVVRWIQNKNKLIAFQGEEDSYDYLDNVEQYLVNIKEGDLVEVLFDKDNNVVCVKKKTGSKTKETKLDVKTETAEKKEVETKTESWTVKAFTGKRDVIKFEESKVPWYLVPEEDDRKILANVKKGDIIKFIVGTTEEKGKEKPSIRSITLEELKKEEPVKPESEKKVTKNVETATKTLNSCNYKCNNSTNNSIERQVCVKSSIEVIKILIEREKEEVSSIRKIREVIKELTKTCLEALSQ